MEYVTVPQFWECEMISWRDHLYTLVARYTFWKWPFDLQNEWYILFHKMISCKSIYRLPYQKRIGTMRVDLHNCHFITVHMHSQSHQPDCIIMFISLKKVTGFRIWLINAMSFSSSLLLFDLFIGMHYEPPLAQSLSILVIPKNLNPYRTLVTQLPRNWSVSLSKKKILKVKQRMEEDNKHENKNPRKPHLRIDPWAHTSGEKHKLIQNKNATHISRYPVMDMIMVLISLSSPN